MPLHKQPKIVLLGATGFIGRILCQHLLKVPNVSLKPFGSSQLDLSAKDACKQLSRELDENTVLIHAARADHTTNPYDFIRRDTLVR